jgi:hypothetical protein
MQSNVTQVATIVFALVCYFVPSGRSMGALTNYTLPAIDKIFAKLTPEQLIKEYEARGLAMAGTSGAPIDGAESSTINISAPLYTVGPTIVRRGREMVPALISFLKREAPLTRKNGVGFTCEILEMLKEIGDPRPVPTILRILDGWDGKATESKRHEALYALEDLTHVSFHSQDRGPTGNIWTSVEHTKAVDSLTQEHASQLYHEWLSNEGKDSNQWLALAKARAKALLSSENKNSVYCANEFLTRGYWKEK